VPPAVLTATSVRYGRVLRTFDPATTTEITLHFAVPASLLVEISGYLGSGLESRATLTCHPLLDDGTEDGPGSLSDRPDATGKVVLAPLQPGRYRVTLLHQGFDGSGHRPVHEQIVAVTPGTNRLLLPLQPLFTITVLAASDRQASHLWLNAINKDGGETWSLEGRPAGPGRAIFDRVPAGIYRLRDNQGREMTIKVTGPAVVEFRPPPPRRAAILLSDPEGRLASFGLNDQDLVIAFDGAGFSNREELVQLIETRLTFRDPAVVTLVRENSVIEVEMDPAFTSILLGGRLVLR
jgi:hypothetical protein